MYLDRIREEFWCRKCRCERFIGIDLESAREAGLTYKEMPEDAVSVAKWHLWSATTTNKVQKIMCNTPISKLMQGQEALEKLAEEISAPAEQAEGRATEPAAGPLGSLGSSDPIEITVVLKKMNFELKCNINDPSELEAICNKFRTL